MTSKRLNDLDLDIMTQDTGVLFAYIMRKKKNPTVSEFNITRNIKYTSKWTVRSRRVVNRHLRGPRHFTA
jgi:hypothetical protein